MQIGKEHATNISNTVIRYCTGAKVYGYNTHYLTNFEMILCVAALYIYIYIYLRICISTY